MAHLSNYRRTSVLRTVARCMAIALLASSAIVSFGSVSYAAAPSFGGESTNTGGSNTTPGTGTPAPSGGTSPSKPGSGSTKPSDVKVVTRSGTMSWPGSAYTVPVPGASGVFSSVTTVSNPPYSKSEVSSNSYGGGGSIQGTGTQRYQDVANAISKCFGKQTTYSYPGGQTLTVEATGMTWKRVDTTQDWLTTIKVTWGGCVYPPKGTVHSVRCPISVGPTQWSGPYGSNVDVSALPVSGARRGSDGSFAWTDSQITYSAFARSYSPGLSAATDIALYKACTTISGGFSTTPVSYGNYRAVVSLPFRTCSYVDRGSGYDSIDLGCTSVQTATETKWYHLMCDGSGGVAVGKDYSNQNFDVRLCQQTSFHCVADGAPTIKTPEGQTVANGTQMTSDGGKWSFTWPAAAVVNDGAMKPGSITNLQTALVISSTSGSPFNKTIASDAGSQPIVGTPSLSGENNKSGTVPGWGKTTYLQAYKGANFNDSTGKVDSLNLFQRQWFTATFILPIVSVNPDTGAVTNAGTTEKVLQNYCDTTSRATVTVVGSRNASGR